MAREGAGAGWQGDLERWLAPFLERLGHKARRRTCPLYVARLIGPGDRKSVQPMAERLGLGTHDRLHHFVSAGNWDAAPLLEELARQADGLLGGHDAVLVVDDTALPKKGNASVGVAPQYASALGKQANCQTMVSLSLARGELGVTVGLRLFLPNSWTADPERMQRAGVPAEFQAARTKPEIAVEEIDRLRAGGLRFGMSKMIADWFVGREIVLAMGIFVNSFPIGVALALALLGPLVDWGGVWLALLIPGLLAGLALGLLRLAYRPHQARGAAGPALRVGLHLRRRLPQGG